MKFKKSDKLIEGVEVKNLKKITTYDTNNVENGWLIDVLRGTDEIKKDGKNFSQVYVTVAYPGAIKGFHCHRKKVDMFCVIRGTAKLVVVDDRENSSTKDTVNEFVMGDEGEYVVVRIPKQVKHAFKTIGKDDAYILNYMDPAYDKDDPDNYEWHEYEIE